MRKLFILICFACVQSFAFAQQITRIEYFFDNDPGTGNGIRITIPAGDTIRTTQDIPAVGLSEGMHVLYIRVRSINGWGLASGHPFYVTAYADTMSKIMAAEYFIDNDPGIGKGKKLAVTSPLDTLKKKYNIKLAATLASGQHFLGVRVKNEAGNWSLYTADTFNVSPSLGFAAQNAVVNNDLKTSAGRLMVFPNPAQDFVNVAVKNSSAQLSITILDLNGVKIRSWMGAGSSVIKLNINDLTAGTYILQVNDGQLTETMKFLKQ